MAKIKGPTRYTCFKLNNVMRKIQRYYETALASYGLTAVQFYIFSILYQNNGIKFKDLAAKANLDGSTVTGLLDRMEAAGFVVKKDDPADRRTLRIFLTEKSEEIAPEVMCKADELEEKLNNLIGEQDYLTFSNVLDLLFTEEV